MSKVLQIISTVTVMALSIIGSANAAVEDIKNAPINSDNKIKVQNEISTTPAEQQHTPDSNSLRDANKDVDTMSSYDDKALNSSNNVSQVSKADGSIIDKLVNSLNNKEVEDVVQMFANDEFVLIDNLGHVIKSDADLRKYITDKFASHSKTVYTAQVEDIKEVAPNLALITAQYNIFEDDKNSVPMAKMHVSTIVKYDGNAWKIISQQFTNFDGSVAIVKETDPTIKMILIGLIGALIGFFGSKFMVKRQY